MEELKIYKYQAEQIENTLRLIANIMGSRNKETCLDRDIMRSDEFIKEVLLKSEHATPSFSNK